MIKSQKRPCPSHREIHRYVVDVDVNELGFIHMEGGVYVLLSRLLMMMVMVTVMVMMIV